MKKSWKIALVVLTILLISGGFILAYRYFDYDQTTSNKSKSPSKTTKPNPTSTTTPIPESTEPDPDIEQSNITKVKAYSDEIPYLRGINMGNGLEAPSYEGEWGLKIQDEHFKALKDAGFNFVRIPIRWSAHSEKNAPYKIDEAFLARVDHIVNEALKQDLTVMINIHHFEEICLDPAANKDKFISLWNQIATHYKGYSDKLLFELLNEPNGKFVAYMWNDYFNEALKTIRSTNPNRTVVIGPTNWNAISDLQYLTLPANEKNIIATFHFYDPFNFTHQGAEWASGMDKYLGTTWRKSTAQQQEIVNKLNKAATWAQKNNIHIILGEFGAYGKADMTSRARWTDFVAREAEKRNMSWAYWEFGCGFGAYDQSSKKWKPELLKALIPE